MCVTPAMHIRLAVNFRLQHVMIDDRGSGCRQGRSMVSWFGKSGGGKGCEGGGSRALGCLHVYMSACPPAITQWRRRWISSLPGWVLAGLGAVGDGGFSRHNNPNRLSAWGDPPAQRASCQPPRVWPAAMVAGFRSLPAAAPAAAAASSTSPPSEPRLRP